MTFKDFQLHEALEKAIEDLGFSTPTEVQQKAVPKLINGEDLIVKSKTGSGKTAAFTIPILERLHRDNAIGHPEYPAVLILAPTRELAVQVSQDFSALSRHIRISVVTVYGQHSMNVEIDALKKGASVIVGTPGRVMDHLRQGNIDPRGMQYLVLDEADKMMDMGFLDQVVGIIDHLPKQRQTMLFSATMPFEIQNICWEYMINPETIEISSGTKTVDSIDQCYYRVEHHEKRMHLAWILKHFQPTSCMVFCNTRATVDRVQEFLEKKGYSSDALHGAITQTKRLKTINQFKRNGFQVLVATDVAARGLHVEELSLVINYDLPVELDSYVHRIGRTGRAGNGGKAVSLVTAEDVMTLYAIEEHIGALIPEESTSDLERTDRHARRQERIVSHETKQRDRTPPAGIPKQKSSKKSIRIEADTSNSVKAPRTSKTLRTPSAPYTEPIRRVYTAADHKSGSGKIAVIATGKARSYSKEEVAMALHSYREGSGRKVKKQSLLKRVLQLFSRG